MIEKYYEILGVNAASSLSEIRKSYRQQAKAWHPDVNKSPGAHEKFILLREAYEYLTDLKSGRPVHEAEVVNTWTDERAEEARARAAKYAEMNYRDFKKSDYSRGGEALEVVADHINLVFAFIFAIILLSVLTAGLGPLGFIMGIVFASITIFFSYHGVEGGVDVKKFLKSIWLIISHSLFRSVVIFIFNICMVLIVGFQTLIPLQTLLWMYIGAIVLMLLVVLFGFNIRSGFKLRFYPICVAPLIVNAFLILNYLFSSGPQKETYNFTKQSYRTSRGRTRQTSLIYLDSDKYDEIEGIRMFVDFESLLGRSRITYTFEDGLFGLRVMKDYELD